MSTATITSKGQITLPRAIRESLGVDRGDRIEFIKDRQGEFHIRPLKQRSMKDLYGMLDRPDMRARTIEEMDRDLGNALAEDDERIRAGR